MKNLLALSVLVLAFMSCEKDEPSDAFGIENVIVAEEKVATEETTTTEEATEETTDTDVIDLRVLGKWQLYLDEQFKVVPKDLTKGDETWVSTDRVDSDITVEIKQDGTYVDRTGDIKTGAGNWTTLGDNTFYLEATSEKDPDIKLRAPRVLSLICNNTNSTINKGEEKVITYFRKVGTIECADQIDYKVKD